MARRLSPTRRMRMRPTRLPLMLPPTSTRPQVSKSDENNNFKDAFGDVDMTLNGLDPSDIEATGEEVRMSTSNPQGSFSLNGIL
ncbi:hypothetical protein NEUTE2DRAFT_82980 [Neurospora tetrasperma FGSC 2509]|nr:hypothetical protein NEUTE2DRAFT_82980 [Neurospora tetrasperma FGSC 2509]